MAELPNDNINDNKSDNISHNTSNGDTNDDAREACGTREAVRRQFYKNRIRRDNVKLEFDDCTPQEGRRKLLLEYQKKYRDENINTARGILQKYSTSENEKYMEEEYMEYAEMEYTECMNEEDMDEEGVKDEKYMDVEGYASWYYKIIPNESKSYRMMLSEWMLDVPQDFNENWIMVPCPTGNRVRLISGWGETRAYSRKGTLHSVFSSALPGGNPNSDMHNSAAVDAIWIKKRKVFYILDILYWATLPFTNCEAEFRLFWLRNKFLETPEFKERGTDTNSYPILTLPNINCNLDFNSALRNLDDELNPLDGFLFYHRNAFYIYGYTPLVTWLKPFMLPEVLGISVPSFLDKKPDGYISFEHHIQKVTTKKSQKKEITIPEITNSMEIEGVV